MLHCEMTHSNGPMIARTTLVTVLAVGVALATLRAASLSRQEADTFQRKIDAIQRQANASSARPGLRRTPVSETEVNSWFAYRAQPLLPRGVADPKITIVGNGKLMGTVLVDLSGVSNGSSVNPFTYFGGRVPVNVSGVLRTENGEGRFDLESADISGLPVPKPLIQQVLSYYSKTESHPQGIRLDDPFELPANIQKIEVGQAQAVVVQ
jgi:hypothetical protein